MNQLSVQFLVSPANKPVFHPQESTISKILKIISVVSNKDLAVAYGGSWNQYAPFCEFDFGYSEFANECYNYLGFRIVRKAD